MTDVFVLVAGWPGSGKSTVATALAAELGLPLLSKDVVKEALMDALGRPESVAESRRLGRAAVLALLSVARTSRGAVLDSTFFDYARPSLESLPGRVIEVHCQVAVELARRRYRERTAIRHAGHLDDDRDDDELWGAPSTTPGVGAVVELDTSTGVDIVGLAATVRHLADVG